MTITFFCSLKIVDELRVFVVEVIKRIKGFDGANTPEPEEESSSVVL